MVKEEFPGPLLHWNWSVEAGLQEFEWEAALGCYGL